MLSLAEQVSISVYVWPPRRNFSRIDFHRPNAPGLNRYLKWLTVEIQLSQDNYPQSNIPIAPQCPRLLPLSLALGYCLQGMFTLCLNLHGLWPKADSADPNDDSGYGVQPGEDERSCRSSAALGEEGVLRGMILEVFRTATPPRAPFLGRDPPYLRQRQVGDWRRIASRDARV